MHIQVATDDTPKIACLDDYAPYARLMERKRILPKYGHITALAPFLLWLVVAVPRYENSKLAIFFVFATIAWAGAVAAYGMGVIIYWAAFRCPRCRRRFGTDDDECWACGLPRHCSSLDRAAASNGCKIAVTLITGLASWAHRRSFVSSPCRCCSALTFDTKWRG